MVKWLIQSQIRFFPLSHSKVEWSLSSCGDLLTVIYDVEINLT